MLCIIMNGYVYIGLSYSKLLLYSKLQTLIVRTVEPPLNGMSVQIIRRGATDVTVALVLKVLYA